MFYNLKKNDKIIISIILFFLFYSALNFFFLVVNQLPLSIDSYVALLKEGILIKSGISFLLVFLLVWAVNNSLDFKAAEVGDGQHGDAHFGTQKEIDEEFTHCVLGKEKTPGILLNTDGKNSIVDCSDASMALVAAPGGGKTLRSLIPTIYYNASVNLNYPGKGASMICGDIKGGLRKRAERYLIKCGYQTISLDFREIFKSYHFNLLESVNLSVDQYHEAEKNNDKMGMAKNLGRAERYAKIVAKSIVANMDSSTTNTENSFFKNTAEGLIVSIILLVSLYGKPEERHIISVFQLIIELNGLEEGSTDVVQKNRLNKLLEHIDNQRIINYSGAATTADVRTSMNVFSSALSDLLTFIDAELEQMICRHSPEINAKSFIEKPVVIFLVIPDENTTRHFFASLFVRSFMNESIDIIEREYRGTAPKVFFLILDEFGQYPKIQDADVLFSAIRERGCRIIISIQSYSQLRKHYSENEAQIIQETLQITMFTSLAFGAYKIARQFSDALGTKTILSGTVSSGRGYSSTRQMISRPLMYVYEIMQISKGKFICIKDGIPYKFKLLICYDYLEIDETPIEKSEREIIDVSLLTSVFIERRARQQKIKIEKGMFD